MQFNSSQGQWQSPAHIHSREKKCKKDSKNKLYGSQAPTRVLVPVPAYGEHWTTSVALQLN